MSQYNPSLTETDAASITLPRPPRKLRGIPLVATWAILIAAPWVVIYHVTKLVF